MLNFAPQFVGNFPQFIELNIQSEENEFQLPDYIDINQDKVTVTITGFDKDRIQVKDGKVSFVGL